VLGVAGAARFVYPIQVLGVAAAAAARFFSCLCPSLYVIM